MPDIFRIICVGQTSAAALPKGAAGAAVLDGVDLDSGELVSRHLAIFKNGAFIPIRWLIDVEKIRRKPLIVKKDAVMRIGFRGMSTYAR